MNLTVSMLLNYVQCFVQDKAFSVF